MRVYDDEQNNTIVQFTWIDLMWFIPGLVALIGAIAVLGIVIAGT